MIMSDTRFRSKNVAPYTGAWIEIFGVSFLTIPPLVAPYTGAWIEIGSAGATAFWYVSHPTRVRGLKSPTSIFAHLSAQSHPTRVRGLKYQYACIRCLSARRTLHGCVD